MFGKASNWQGDSWAVFAEQLLLWVVWGWSQIEAIWEPLIGQGNERQDMRDKNARTLKRGFQLVWRSWLHKIQPAVWTCCCAMLLVGWDFEGQGNYKWCSV